MVYKLLGGLREMKRSNKRPISLGNGISLVDGYDLDVESRTGIYVLEEEELTIIETGPSPSVPYIKEGLEALGHDLTEVKYIILTHIHLDHGGGAGRLLQLCPNATIIVHPKGKRHLVDPKKLAAGARAIYGESFSDLFDPIIPVSEDRIIVKTEGDNLTIGPDRKLEFWDTPGHSRHHIGIYDPVSNGMFTGDTAGIRYEQLIPHGIDYFLPSTSPNHFDPVAMRASIERMRKKSLDYIYFGHFGATDLVNQTFNQVESWLDIFVEEGERAVAEEKGYDAIAKGLLKKVQADLQDKGIPDDHKVYTIINLDLQVSALGIIDYLQKQSS